MNRITKYTKGDKVKINYFCIEIDPDESYIIVDAIYNKTTNSYQYTIESQHEGLVENVVIDEKYIYITKQIHKPTFKLHDVIQPVVLPKAQTYRIVNIFYDLHHEELLYRVCGSLDFKSYYVTEKDIFGSEV